MLEKIETFERFSPTIMQFKVSDRFVNIVNTTIIITYNLIAFSLIQLTVIEFNCFSCF